MTDRAPQVDRQLPTEESRDLLALVREIAQREIRPLAADEEDAGRFPARSSDCSPRPGCSVFRTPASSAAANSPTRSTSRSWRSWPRPA